MVLMITGRGHDQQYHFVFQKNGSSTVLMITGQQTSCSMNTFNALHKLVFQKHRIYGSYVSNGDYLIIEKQFWCLLGFGVFRCFSKSTVFQKLFYLNLSVTIAIAIHKMVMIQNLTAILLS